MMLLWDTPLKPAALLKDMSNFLDHMAAKYRLHNSHGLIVHGAVADEVSWFFQAYAM